MFIKNGYLIPPHTNTSAFADIRVEDGIITAIGQLTANENEEFLDITGLTIAPGLIDTHIHFRDPGFEDVLYLGGCETVIGADVLGKLLKIIEEYVGNDGALSFLALGESEIILGVLK